MRNLHWRSLLELPGIVPAHLPWPPWAVQDNIVPGSTQANGREPKSCLGQVFIDRLDCFDEEHVFIYVDAQPHL